MTVWSKIGCTYQYSMSATLTWVVLFESGKVGIGVENRGNGWEFSKLLIFFPALETALIVGKPISLCLSWGRWGGGGCWGRGSRPGAFLTPIWTEKSSSVPVHEIRCYRFPLNKGLTHVNNRNIRSMLWYVLCIVSSCRITYNRLLENKIH